VFIIAVLHQTCWGFSLVLNSVLLLRLLVM
jgi:hypothetical protein